MNLDFAKVCGKHSAIYEAYYKQIDPKGSGAIEAMTAAKFLKKSGLSDVVLSRIWDLSDPNGKGFLDKPGFFVALKLVSLAQCGQVISMSSIYTETANPPKVGDLPKIMPPRIQTVPVSSGGVASGDWSISVIDRLKYEQLFESLKPVGGMLPGNKVKGVLMDSKLPMDTLGKIWDLADQDKDGNLDKHEFIVAMHLVYQTLDKRTVPDVLPMELRKPAGAATHGAPPPKPAPPVVAPAMPRAPSGEGFGDGGFVANFPKDIAPPPAPVIPSLPVVPPMTRVPPVGSASVQAPLIGSIDPLIPIGAPPSVTANADWVVTAAEMKRFEVMFRDSDRDKDGLVSGLEVKNVFLQSGVPQNCLAHIWALCDTNQSGKLTLEQFALAMWMVERKQKGIEPPQALIANMVPPSMRSTVSGIDMQPQEPKPAYSNPELEMISKEIEELAKERRSLETEIAQKEADLRIKTGEVRSLQSELDTLSATLKQLENQRGEAQKRLDDLMAQVNKIREQSQKQEETINEQEGELNAKRSELQKLKDEETALQKEYDDNNRELQKLTQHLQNTQLQISSVRSMVTQLMETQRQMTDALLMCRAAIENQDGELVTEYQLKIEPDFDEAHRVLEKKVDEPKDSDPFEDNKSAAAKTNGNGFATNGFDSDPFGGLAALPTAAAAAPVNTARGGFDDSFNTTNAFDAGFDAFAGSGGFGQQKDPFGGDAFGASVTEKKSEAPKDDFGSDPFAALHAPTGQGQVLSPNAQKSMPPPRPESPSPALPPKKSKVPPPRPAPPRPNQGPARPAQPAMDAFGSASAGGGSGGFADFADFDNKLAASATPSSSNFSLLFDTLTTSDATNSANSTNNTNASTLSGTASNTTLTSSSLLSHTSTLHHHHHSQQQHQQLQQQTTESLYNTLAECTSSGSGVGGGSKLQSNSGSPSSSSFTSLNLNNNTTTNNLTNSNLNNHLTRSITPLQQAAAANAFNTPLPATQPASATTIAAAASTSTATTKDKVNVRGPTDFSDDPFKDYRYEDPFNIKDPFADDDDSEPITDPEKIFTESTVVQVVKDTTARSQTPSASNTSLSSDFMDKFSQFSMNPSPVPSHKSSNSLGFSGFDDPKPSALVSSSRNTPVAATGFADFDAFATKVAAPLPRQASPFGGADLKASKDRLNANATPQEAESKANDSFYDAFGDRFATSNAATKANSNNNSTTTAATTFFDDPFGETKTKAEAMSTIPSDPFGGMNAFGDAFATNAKPAITVAAATTTTTQHAFDAFNDNTFEDDFFGMQKAASVGGTTNNNNNTKNSNGLDFAKFDAFGDDFATALNNSKNVSHPPARDSVDGGSSLAAAGSLPPLVKVQNQTTLTKRPNLSANMTADAGATKLPEKFVADYSKAESFQDDMQEAIRRSMMEQ